MRFKVYDFEEWSSAVELVSDDKEISVDVSNAWDDDAADYDEEAIRYIVEEEVNKRFPGSIVEW